MRRVLIAIASLIVITVLFFYLSTYQTAASQRQ
jgi:hypothetical protein